MKILTLIQMWRVARKAYKHYTELFLLEHIELVNPALIKLLDAQGPIHWTRLLLVANKGIEYYKKRLFYILRAIDSKVNPNGELENSQQLIATYLIHVPKSVRRTIVADFKRYRLIDEQRELSPDLNNIMLGTLSKIKLVILNNEKASHPNHTNYPFSDN